MSPTSVPAPEPLNPALEAQLTKWVYELRQRTRRRLFPAVAFLQPLDSRGAPTGAPGRDLLHRSNGEPDHALRVDLLLSNLAATTENTALVVVRQGPAEPTPTDADWRRAWNTAHGIARSDAGPTFAIARDGWVDAGTGGSRKVPRLRNRAA